MNMEAQIRRNSKSQNLEDCINLLSKFISQDIPDEEIQTMIINNSLPVELRSFLWRVLLGIIPKTKDPLEINKAITFSRQSYEAIMTPHKDLLAQFGNDALQNLPIKDEMTQIMKEIDRLSSQSDFLKSQSVITTISKLYYLWRSNTKYEGYYAQPIFILASVAFAVFPAALRPGELGIAEITTIDKATPHNLYYLINNEDYFDADVYSIFSAIMSKMKIIDICIAGNKDLNVVLNYQGLIEEMKDSPNLRSMQAKLDLHQKLSFLYVYLTSKEVISLFDALKFDPFPIYFNWFTFLFTNIFQLNNINYLWDIIFIAKNFNEMTGYIIGAIIKNQKEKLLGCTSSEEAKKILEQFPIEEISLKEIVNKALKIRDLLNDD